MRAADLTGVDWVGLIQKLVKNLVADADRIVDESGVQQVLFYPISIRAFGI